MLCVNRPLDAAISPVFGLCFDKSEIFVMFTASNCEGFWVSLELLLTRISLSMQMSSVCQFAVKQCSAVIVISIIRKEACQLCRLIKMSAIPLIILISKSLCRNANHNVFLLFASVDSSVCGAGQYSVLATSEYLDMRSLVPRNRQETPNGSFTCEKNQILYLYVFSIL